MIESGYQYHWLTAYSRGRMSGHCLDWANQPAFFKDYPAANSHVLSRPDLTGLPEKSLFGLLREVNSPLKTPTSILSSLGCNDLALLLLLTSVPTAKSTFPQGEIWYRSNASAGALHPLEFYLSFSGADDLPAGIYHYDLLKPALNRLSANPALEIIAAACRDDFDSSDGNSQTATIIISATFFRTAWKYRDRAYRYLLLDCGHALENLTLALHFMGFDFAVVLDFADSVVNQSLGFDEKREVALVAIRFRPPQTSSIEPQPIPDPPGSDRQPVLQKSTATHVVEYSSLNEIHSVTAVSLLKEAGPENCGSVLRERVSEWRNIPENPVVPDSAVSYIDSLSRRRSRRNFIGGGAAGLTINILHLLLDSILKDRTTSSARLRPEIIFSVNGIEGLQDGLYLLDFAQRRYALLNGQNSGSKLATAALDQRWVAKAALQFIFFADLEAAEKEFGPRSYRYLNINAGRFGQRLYLGATALDLGCCAVGAFYDRELAEICRLGQNYDPLYLVAIGPVAGKKDCK